MSSAIPHAEVNSPGSVSSSKRGLRVIAYTFALLPWSDTFCIAPPAARAGLRFR